MPQVPINSLLSPHVHGYIYFPRPVTAAVWTLRAWWQRTRGLHNHFLQIIPLFFFFFYQWSGGELFLSFLFPRVEGLQPGLIQGQWGAESALCMAVLSAA